MKSNMIEKKPRGSTSLLGEAPGGVWQVFSGTVIDVEHKKKVDLGVLRGAACHELDRKARFSTVDILCVR